MLNIKVKNMIIEELIVVEDLKNTDLVEKSLEVLMKEACSKIAPVWPLENFVAVNPYSGLLNKKFNTVANDLKSAADIKMTLPKSFYLNKISKGKITNEDIATVLLNHTQYQSFSPAEFLKITNKEEVISESTTTENTFVDWASKITGKDWNRFVSSRISNWSASYFDVGQAVLTSNNKLNNLFKSWKIEAEIDRTVDVSGLKGFRNVVKSLSDNPQLASQQAIEILGIPTTDLENYLHSLLLKVGGWSGYAARIDWDSRLYTQSEGTLMEFLAVLLCWEACMLKSLSDSNLSRLWRERIKFNELISNQNGAHHSLTETLIFQEAFERSMQRNLIGNLNSNKAVNTNKVLPFKLQAVFCIDVRSEVYRRNLESLDANIETFGFAGFFGLPINYVPIAYDKGVAQCPVLLKTGPTILDEIPNEKENQRAVNQRINNQHFRQIWKSFKSTAVSCFSFVSPMGLTYLPKLFTDSYGLSRPISDPNKSGISKKYYSAKKISLVERVHNHESTGISFSDQCEMSKNILSAMSLKDNFGKYILIVGHGSTSVNNPHAAGLDCGACGGNSGELNAKVAVSILNNKNVRIFLRHKGIEIPSDTVFLSCLHNTTTDDMTIFNLEDISTDSIEELNLIQSTLKNTSSLTRNERAKRMSINGNVDVEIRKRSKDWSQTRPEWGLAGCNAFIIAPRSRSKGVNLEGKSFLHSYEWREDKSFSILELIMTAPMIVTSWINLQYYASTVDNKNYGSGNKTLHNVTAGLGVIEGVSGDLRSGLPMQSIFDGENYQHEPHKLNVIIEAPIEAMNSILEKHESVRNLCDNGWLYLFSMNDEGKVSKRYLGNGIWEEVA